MALTLIDVIFPSGCIVCGTRPKPICSGCKPVTEIGEVEGFGFPVFYAHNHQGAIEKLISGYKDQQLTALEKVLVDSTAELFGRLDLGGISALILPAKNARNYRKRGFDPAKSIARRALKVTKLDIPVINLANARKRSDQRGLGRDQRASNVLGSMRLDAQVNGKVMLFDDVLTTGATISELARSCEAAEVEVAFGCVLAQRFTQY